MKLATPSQTQDSDVCERGVLNCSACIPVVGVSGNYISALGPAIGGSSPKEVTNIFLLFYIFR